MIQLSGGFIRMIRLMLYLTLVMQREFNGLFRQVIEETGKHLYWVSLNTDGDAETQKGIWYAV